MGLWMGGWGRLDEVVSWGPKNKYEGNVGSEEGRRRRMRSGRSSRSRSRSRKEK